MTTQVGASNTMIAWNATTDNQGNITTANNPTLDPTTSQKTSGTTGTTAAGAALMQDSVSESAKPYETLQNGESALPPAGAPRLEPGTGDIRMAYEQPGIKEIYKSLVTNLPKTEPSPENTFFKSVNKQTMKLTKDGLGKTMEKAAEKLGSSVLEVQAQVQFAVMHPDVPVDPEIRAIADKVTKKAEKASIKEFGLDPSWSPPSDSFEKQAEKMDAFFQANGYVAFMLGDNEGVDPEKLRFAEANPELTPQLDPETVRVANKLAESSSQTAEISWGAPTGWKPTPKKGDSESAVNSRVRSTYTNEFEEGVAKLLDKGKITRAESLQMRAQFYNHAADIPLTSNAAEYLAQVVNAAQEEIQKKFGTPVGYAPTVPKWNSEGVIKGTYADKFIAELLESNLSTSDQKLLTSVLFGETSLGLIKGDLRKTLDKITDKVSKEIDQEFGVKYAIIPDIPPAFIAAASKGDRVLSKSALKLAQEFVGAKLSEAGLISPDDPNRVLIIDAMKVISLALSRLSMILTEAAIADTELSKKNAIGQMEIQLTKLDKQRVQIKEQIEQFEKQQSMGIIGIILSVILCFVAFIVGPVAFCIAITFTIIQHTVGIEAFVEALASLLEAFGLPKAIAKLLVMIFLILVVAQAGPMVGVDIGMQLIAESKVLQDLAIMFGASKQAAEMFAMAIQMALMVVVMVVGFMFPPAAPQMASVASTMALNMVGTIIKQVMSILQAVMQFVMDVLQPIINALKTVFQAASKVVKAIMNQLKALIQEADELAEAAEAAPALLKQGSQGSQGLMTKIQGYLEKLQTFVEKFKDVASQADDASPLDAASTVGGKAGKSMSTMEKLKSVGTGFKDFADDPAAFMKDLSSQLKQGLKDMAEEMKDLVPEDELQAAMKSSEKSFQESMDSSSLMNFLKKFSSSATDAATDVVKQGGDDVLETAGSTVAKSADDLTGTMAKSADDLTGTVTQSTDDLTAAAKTVGKEGLEAGEDLSKSVTSKIDDAAESTLKVGKSFSQISSAQDFLSFIGNAMRRLKEELIALKDSLAVFLRKIGQDITQIPDEIEGLMSGLIGKVTNLKTSISKLGFSDITQWFEDALTNLRGSFKNTTDGYGRVFEQLRKDPWKWGSANRAFSQGMDAQEHMFDVIKAMEVMSSVVQMISSFMNIIINLNLAEMTREMGKLESDIKLMDGVLEQMKTVQQNLQKDAEALSEHKKSVQEMQKNKWDQLSRIVTQLGAASQGSKG